MGTLLVQVPKATEIRLPQAEDETAYSSSSKTSLVLILLIHDNGGKISIWENQSQNSPSMLGRSYIEMRAFMLGEWKRRYTLGVRQLSPVPTALKFKRYLNVDVAEHRDRKYKERNVHETAMK